MIYSPGLRDSTARSIARLAQQKIRTKTGMNVSIMLCPVATEIIKTPVRMLQVIAASLGMSYDLYALHTRKRDVAEMRFIAAMLIRVHFPDVKLIQIAHYFGGLDHTSVISGLSRAQDLIYAGDQRFIAKYNTALAAVNNWLDNVSRMAA